MHHVLSHLPDLLTSSLAPQQFGERQRDVMVLSRAGATCRTGLRTAQNPPARQVLPCCTQIVSYNANHGDWAVLYLAFAHIVPCSPLFQGVKYLTIL